MEYIEAKNYEEFVAYTNSITTKAKENIDELLRKEIRKWNHDFYSSEDVNTIRENLLKPELFATPGFILRRFIQNHYPELIEEACAKSGIKPEKIADLSINKNESWPADMVKSLSKSLTALRRKDKKLPSLRADRTWEVWLKDERIPDRESIFKIAFVLKMKIKDVAVLLNAVDGTTFNLRNKWDFVCFIYLERNLYDWDAVEDIVSTFNNTKPEISKEISMKKRGRKKKGEGPILTDIGKTNVHFNKIDSYKNIDLDEEELKSAIIKYMYDNIESFTGYSRTVVEKLYQFVDYYFPLIYAEIDSTGNIADKQRTDEEFELDKYGTRENQMKYAVLSAACNSENIDTFLKKLRQGIEIDSDIKISIADVKVYLKHPEEKKEIKLETLGIKIDKIEKIFIDDEYKQSIQIEETKKTESTKNSRIKESKQELMRKAVILSACKSKNFNVFQNRLKQDFGIDSDIKISVKHSKEDKTIKLKTLGIEVDYLIKLFKDKELRNNVQQEIEIKKGDFKYYRLVKLVNYIRTMYIENETELANDKLSNISYYRKPFYKKFIYNDINSDFGSSDYSYTRDIEMVFKNKRQLTKVDILFLLLVFINEVKRITLEGNIEKDNLMMSIKQIQSDHFKNIYMDPDYDECVVQFIENMLDYSEDEEDFSSFELRKDFVNEMLNYFDFLELYTASPAESLIAICLMEESPAEAYISYFNGGLY